MRIAKVRLKNFQCFGPKPTEVDLDAITYVLGRNGTGKTALLQALARMFSPSPTQRAVRASDFHVPLGGTPHQLVGEARTLWLEVILEFPETDSEDVHASVPTFFSRMRLTTADGAPQVRVRLTANLSDDGHIEERIEYITKVAGSDEPLDTSPMSHYERGRIEVHYLPARRDPSELLSFTANSLLGRLLRAVDWSEEREALTELSEKITEELAANKPLKKFADAMAGVWSGLHAGDYLTHPSMSFGYSELEGLLRQLTVSFTPTPGGVDIPASRLSDGQKSLLYLTLVLAWQNVARAALSGEEEATRGLNIDRLRPPVHSIIALEEPENSLAPFYLGRVLGQLQSSAKTGSTQSVIATHSAAVVGRSDPAWIRFLRLDNDRTTMVQTLELPPNAKDEEKYVREAVRAYPELYFSRLVILGEGASEQIVLPRVLSAFGMAEDDLAISVVPLGGRHVNHFWRLLHELDIPHVTLLDLDAWRYHGGWGRVKNAMKQMNKLNPGTFSEDTIADLPSWDSAEDLDELSKPESDTPTISVLREKGVFFSSPLDLDFAMMEAFPEAYDAGESDPSEETLSAALGKGRAKGQISDSLGDWLESYRTEFLLRSKPSVHLEALAEITDEDLREGVPEPIGCLVEYVRVALKEIPE